MAADTDIVAQGAVQDPPAQPRATRRVALGVSYRGSAYHGWQSQGGGVPTVQGALEAALSAFATVPISVLCAGRTDRSEEHTSELQSH